MFGCVEPLRDGHTTNVSYLAKSRRSVAIITRDDDGNQLAVPVLSHGTQKDRDDVRPSPRFGYRLKTELAIENMQITLGWDDERKRKPTPTVDGAAFYAARAARASLQFQGRSSLSLEARWPRASWSMA